MRDSLMATQNVQSEQFVDELLQLFSSYQELLEKSGYKVRRSQASDARVMFVNMDAIKQKYLLSRLTSEIAIMQDLRHGKERTTDSTKQLWRYLKLNRLSPCSDLFDKVTETDVLQLFSPEQTLLFVSTNIYDIVSFTMEQLYTQTWYESTKRDPVTEHLLAQAAMKVFAGEFNE